MKWQFGSALGAALAVVAVAMGTLVAADEQDKSVPARQGDAQPAAAAGEKTPDHVSPGKRVTLPPGARLKDNPTREDHGDILKTLDTLTEAALTKDGFDDVVERFVDADRNRLGKEGATERKYDDLNALADSLRTLWKSKYGKDFAIDPKRSFTHVATLVGEIEDPQAFAANWPVPLIAPDVVAAVPEAVPAAAKEPPARPAPGDPDANIERGRDVAIATFQESEAEDLPALHLSLIQEAIGWRVDIPEQLNGQRLHDSLVRHLTHLRDTQANWPVLEGPAGLMVARHVAMAVYGVEPPKSGEGDKTRSPESGARRGGTPE